MKEFLYVHKTKIIICTIGIVCLLLFLSSKLLSPPETSLPPSSLEMFPKEEVSASENVYGEEEMSPALPTVVLIDIKGAVRVPGVYELKSDERVIDAVERAGGFSEYADTRKVNLASLLVDEMVIFVPEEGEEVDESLFVQSKTRETHPENAIGAKININTATEEELTMLSGVGPSKAKAIVDYRTENGLFKSIEDIVHVSGIGEKSLEKIRNEITTSN